LFDILGAIELIESFMPAASDFAEFQRDMKTRSAVERQLAIIGEAVNKFQQLEPNNGLSDSAAIIGLRNRIIHAYDSLDASIIFHVVTKKLGGLRAEVEQALVAN
jgi:uncharacterized protein with HEPN domain